MVEVKRTWPRLSGTLLLMTLVSVGLYAVGIVHSITVGYGYMVWNLFLGWLSVGLIMWLLHMLRYKRWSSWQGIGLSVLWLVFLPNSFYLVSDLIHIEDAPQNGVTYTAVMLMSFALNGLVLGYTSLYLFHVELKKRLPPGTARNIIAFVLLLCSFAIYVGRDLRWNTWDIFLNPAGLLFDLSSRFINPFGYPRMFSLTGAFFLLLTTTYIALWNIAGALKRPHAN